MHKNILMVAAVLLLGTVPVDAHPPADIKLTVAGETVRVYVEHSVSNPATHYVKLIRISQEGLTPVERALSGQEGAGVTLEIAVPGLQPAQPVTVEAFCSRYGEIRKVIIPEKSA